MNDTIAVIDGKGLAYRCFYADPARPVIDGFLGMMRKIGRRAQPKQWLVAWESGATFRHAVYAEYKAGRRTTPQALREQMATLPAFIEQAGVKVKAYAEYEADDILSSIAYCASRQRPVLLVSEDKDVLQCLCSDVRALTFSQIQDDSPPVTQFDVFRKWQVPPDRLPDVFGLMGDSVDNIPGVPGIGKKIARDLISRGGSLEGVYERLEHLAPLPKIRRALEKHRDDAFLSRRLATLATGIATLEDLCPAKDFR